MNKPELTNGLRVTFKTPRSTLTRDGTIVGIDNSGKRGAYYVVRDDANVDRRIRAGYIKPA